MNPLDPQQLYDIPWNAYKHSGRPPHAAQNEYRARGPPAGAALRGKAPYPFRGRVTRALRRFFDPERIPAATGGFTSIRIWSGPSPDQIRTKSRRDPTVGIRRAGQAGAASARPLEERPRARAGGKGGWGHDIRTKSHRRGTPAVGFGPDIVPPPPLSTRARAGAFFQRARRSRAGLARAPDPYGWVAARFGPDLVRTWSGPNPYRRKTARSRGYSFWIEKAPQRSCNAPPERIGGLSAKRGSRRGAARAIFVLRGVRRPPRMLICIPRNIIELLWIQRIHRILRFL